MDFNLNHQFNLYLPQHLPIINIHQYNLFKINKLPLIDAKCNGVFFDLDNISNKASF